MARRSNRCPFPDSDDAKYNLKIRFPAKNCTTDDDDADDLLHSTMQNLKDTIFKDDQTNVRTLSHSLVLSLIFERFLLQLFSTVISFLTSPDV